MAIICGFLSSGNWPETLQSTVPLRKLVKGGKKKRRTERLAAASACASADGIVVGSNAKVNNGSEDEGEEDNDEEPDEVEIDEKGNSSNGVHKGTDEEARNS